VMGCTRNCTTLADGKWCAVCARDLEDAAREEGRRAGYAACQADVEAWLRGVGRQQAINLASWIEAGDHVGAAGGKR